jgi:hypothetical protein
MNDFLGIIGLACLNQEFREDLLANGVAAVETHHLSANKLTVDERRWLDYFRTATAEKKTAAAQAFAAVGTSVAQVCEQPPCASYSADGSPTP